MNATATKPMWAQMAASIAFASTLWLGLHLYVAWRLAASFGPLSAPVLGTVTVLVAASPILILAITWTRFDRPAVRGRYIAYLYIGAFSLVVVSLLAAHLVLSLWSLAAEVTPALQRNLAAGALLLAAGLTVAAAINALRPVPLVEVSVPIDDLHPDLDGYRIVLLSDVHVGAPATAADLEAVVATAKAANGDLIAFVGDLADGRVEVLGDEVSAIGELTARDGAYFVTGNHEYYSGVDAWLGRVDELGLQVLTNTHRRVAVGDATLVVAGVPDVTGRQFVPSHRSDPAQAVGDATDADFVLLLAHQPRSIHAAERAGVDLQLSGHTHGGQYLPFTWLVGLFNPYSRGLHRHGRTWIYVSCGSGLWGPPLRLGAPAEVTAITLVRRAA